MVALEQHEYEEHYPSPPHGSWAWLRVAVTHEVAHRFFTEYGTDVWPEKLYEIRDKHLGLAFRDLIKMGQGQDPNQQKAIAWAAANSAWIEFMEHQETVTQPGLYKHEED